MSDPTGTPKCAEWCGDEYGPTTEFWKEHRTWCSAACRDAGRPLNPSGTPTGRTPDCVCPIPRGWCPNCHHECRACADARGVSAPTPGSTTGGDETGPEGFEATIEPVGELDFDERRALRDAMAGKVDPDDVPTFTPRSMRLLGEDLSRAARERDKARAEATALKADLAAALKREADLRILFVNRGEAMDAIADERAAALKREGEARAEAQHWIVRDTEAHLQWAAESKVLRAKLDVADRELDTAQRDAREARERAMRLETALVRIGQVDNDTGDAIDDVCAECQGWAVREVQQRWEKRLPCGTDCPGRIARRALASVPTAEAK